MSEKLQKIISFIEATLDTATIVFLFGKAISYFVNDNDELGALFTCAAALWCISHKVWHINNKLESK